MKRILYVIYYVLLHDGVAPKLFCLRFRVICRVRIQFIHRHYRILLKLFKLSLEPNVIQTRHVSPTEIRRQEYRERSNTAKLGHFCWVLDHVAIGCSFHQFPFLCGRCRFDGIKVNIVPVDKDLHAIRTLKSVVIRPQRNRLNLHIASKWDNQNQLLISIAQRWLGGIQASIPGLKQG